MRHTTSGLPWVGRIVPVTTCPRCGRENAADARFCSNCGNSLVTRVSVQERRVVTALFADLARSTGMGESLDPEVVRGIVGRFFELCSREVAARGGRSRSSAATL